MIVLSTDAYVSSKPLSSTLAFVGNSIIRSTTKIKICIFQDVESSTKSPVSEMVLGFFMTKYIIIL